MKIAVVGTGAMGSVYAALLADAGNEVWAIDLWQDHVDAINRMGLRLEGASGDRTVKMDATSDSSDCLLYTSPSPRDGLLSRMPSSA